MCEKTNGDLCSTGLILPTFGHHAGTARFKVRRLLHKLIYPQIRALLSAVNMSKRFPEPSHILQRNLLWLGRCPKANSNRIRRGSRRDTGILVAQKETSQNYSSWQRMVGSRRKTTVRGPENLPLPSADLR